MCFVVFIERRHMSSLQTAYGDQAVSTLNDVRALKGNRELEWSDLMGFPVAVRRIEALR